MRRAAPGLVAAVGVLLAALGAVLFRRAGRPAPSVDGWYAYAPLSAAPAYSSRLDVRFDGWAVRWTAGHVLGAALAALGLLALVGAAGWLLGRRTRRRTGVPRRALAVRAVGCLVVVGGIGTVLLSGDRTASCPPGLDCGPWSTVVTAGPLVGLGTAVAGAVLLAAVAGWLLGGDRRADQR